MSQEDIEIVPGRSVTATDAPNDDGGCRPEVLVQARQVRFMLCERYGLAPDGWAAPAVGEFRDEFGVRPRGETP